MYVCMYVCMYVYKMKIFLCFGWIYFIEKGVCMFWFCMFLSVQILERKLEKLEIYYGPGRYRRETRSIFT